MDNAKPQEMNKENQTAMLHGTIKNTSSQPPPTTHGGQTCCAPHCSNNSRRNPKLSYHKMPTDPKFKKIWTELLKTKGLCNPGPNQYLCSAHFPRGQKVMKIIFQPFFLVVQMQQTTKEKLLALQVLVTVK